MTDDPLLDVIDRDGRALVSAAASNWTRPVPDCPDWDAAGLIRHTGGILAWMASIVETGERTSFRSLPPAPDEDAELSVWFLDNLERTLDVMRACEPAKAVWTFSSLGDHRASWWRRRLAVEMAIHRWDAEYAAAVPGRPRPGPLDARVAMVGIEEFVAEFLPGLLAQPAAERPREHCVCRSSTGRSTDCSTSTITARIWWGRRRPTRQSAARRRGCCCG